MLAPAPCLRLSLGLRPRFGLFPGDKGLAIEHRTLVLPRLRIPGLGLGRLPGMGIHAVRVTALEKVLAPGELLLVAMAALRRTPVGTGFLAPPGPLLGTSLAGPEIAEAHPQPDTAHEDHAGGCPQLLGVGEEPFAKPRLAMERSAGRGEDGLRVPPEAPSGVIYKGAGLAPIVFHVPTDAVPTPCALVGVQQIHQPCPEAHASKQTERLHRLLLLIMIDDIIMRQGRGGGHRRAGA